MTSSACQPGEPLLETTTKVAADRSVAGLRVLPFEGCQLFEGNKNSEGIDTIQEDSSVVASKETGDQHKSHEQARSGSSDSGQLSLLSSFGSLSIGGYQFTAPTSPYSTNPSSDTASRQSMSIVDIDQHHFYCSLMLLNSLDLYHYKTQQTSVGEANQQQAEITRPQQTPSLSLSSTGLTASISPEPSLHHKSLQDCRWLAGNETPKQINNNNNNETYKEKLIKGSAGGDKNKKRSSGLSILSGDWQGQGAGKLFAAAAAATNSTSFLDKLLAHMIKKNSGTDGNEGKGKPRAQPMTMSDNNSFAKNSENSNCERMKKKTTQSSGGGGLTGSVGSGLNMLTDLSRRLARRCGVKTKAVQLAGNDGSGSGVQPTNVSGSNASAMSGKRNDNCNEKLARTTRDNIGATGCGADDNELEQAKVSSTASMCDLQGFGAVRNEVKCNANNERNRSALRGNDQSMHHSKSHHTSDQAHQMKGSSLSDVSKRPLIEQNDHEHQQQLNQIQVQHERAASNNNGNGGSSTNLINTNNNNSGSRTNLISSANLNASVSTLSNCCCYCDNETCSSSGFVSSSTTGGGVGGGAGSVSGGCDNSCAHGCTPSGGGISGSGNCGDSNMSTHSCNSSTHNEPQQVSTHVLARPSASSDNSNNCAIGRDIASLGSSSGPNSSHCQVYCDHSIQSENIKDDELSKQKEQLTDRSNRSTCEANMVTVAAAAPTAPSPVHLAAHEIGPQLGLPVDTSTSLPGEHQEADEAKSPSAAEIQVYVAEDQLSSDSHRGSKSSELSDQPNQETKQQSSNAAADGHLKPKTSLLSRARNSTINLASLATVTNRFSSASMGNLWHGASGGHHGSHHRGNLTAGELADDSTEGGIRPLDYFARGAFDSYQPDDSDRSGELSPNAEPRSVKSSAGGNKLLSVASCGSTRKLSTKEKCKRQKEAERVEKLRLLVSYLKSGTSQPVVSPVALEADEIELAEKYKMHVILRDDLLQDTQTSDHHQAQLPSSSSGSMTRSDNNAEHKLERATQLPAEDQVDKVIKDPLINHSVGGTTTSSPASSSSSMNHSAPHSTNDGRSIPHIGDVTWVLRHSISDPGNNNFEHSPSFSVASSSSPSTRDHHHHNHHHHHHSHHQHHQCNPPEHDISAHNPLNNHEASISQCNDHEICNQCRSCAPSSSYSGSSLSNYCLGGLNSNSNNTKGIGSRAQEPAFSYNHQQLPKLFYIDDMDPIPILSSSSPIAPTTFISSPSVTMSAPASGLAPSPSVSAATLNSINQPATPAVSDASVGAASSIDRNSSSASTSAWTNPQNLATWIDNEVNSLVHDLEAKSQQLKLKSESKHNKSGKRKWLSVTGHHSSRRSSAGANST